MQCGKNKRTNYAVKCTFAYNPGPIKSIKSINQFYFARLVLSTFDIP